MSAPVRQVLTVWHRCGRRRRVPVLNLDAVGYAAYKVCHSGRTGRVLLARWEGMLPHERLAWITIGKNFIADEHEQQRKD